MLLHADPWHPALPISPQDKDAETQLSPVLPSAASHRVYRLLDPNCCKHLLAVWVYPSPGAFVSKPQLEKISSIAAPDLPLPKSAEFALTIVLNRKVYPEVCFCPSTLCAADCRRLLTVFELVTDDKREKSVLRNGIILNLVASFLSLQHSRAGSA